MAISEHTRNNLNINLSHKVSTVSAQETAQRNMSDKTAFLVGCVMLLLLFIILLSALL
jgi:flagellar biogenesis protein FliO